MSSMDGEVVEFCHSMYPTGNVEDWLLEVETLMRDSMKKVIADLTRQLSTGEIVSL